METQDVPHGQRILCEHAPEGTFVPFRAPSAEMILRTVPDGLPDIEIAETSPEVQTSTNIEASRTAGERSQSYTKFSSSSNNFGSDTLLKWNTINREWGKNETEKLLLVFNGFRPKNKQKDLNPSSILNVTTVENLRKLAKRFDIGSAENAILCARTSRMEGSSGQRMVRRITAQDVERAYDSLRYNSAARASRSAVASPSVATTRAHVGHDSRSDSVDSLETVSQGGEQTTVGLGSVSPIGGSSYEASLSSINGAVSNSRKRHLDIVSGETSKRSCVERDGDSPRKSLLPQHPSRSSKRSETTEREDIQSSAGTDGLTDDHFARDGQLERSTIEQSHTVEQSSEPDASAILETQLLEAAQQFVAVVDGVRQRLKVANESIPTLDAESTNKLKVFQDLSREVNSCPDLTQTEALKRDRSDALVESDNASEARKVKQNEVRNLKQLLSTAKNVLVESFRVCNEQSDILIGARTSLWKAPDDGIPGEMVLETQP